MPVQETQVEFTSHGTTIRAGHFLPANDTLQSDAGAPCVVMGHGMGGTRAAGLEPFARCFAQAGLHVLCFDYRYFGTSDGQPRQWLSVPKQLQDWDAAIAYARQLGGVDARRIATWGSSFSGAHAVAAAVADGEIAAVSSQGAMMDGLAALFNLIKQCGIGHALKLTGYGIADVTRASMGLGRTMIPVVGHPDEKAALNTPDAKPGYLKLTPPDWKNEITTSWALTLATYRPNKMTPRLPCPALFCIASDDVIVPPAAMEDGAKRAPDKVTVKRYPGGHFDIYVQPVFDQVSKDQAEFFVRVLEPDAA